MMIDASANVVAYEDYYPFGMTMEGRSFVNIEPRYRFTGKEKSTPTWRYLFGARTYNPLSGKWDQVDPMNDFYPEISPFVYVHNRPINSTDPTGMWDDDGRNKPSHVLPDVVITAPDPNKWQPTTSWARIWDVFTTIINGGGPTEYAYAKDENGQMYRILRERPEPDYYNPDGTPVFLNKVTVPRIVSNIGRSSKLTKALDYALKESKYNHIFRPNHNLNTLVVRFGGEEGVLKVIINSVQNVPNGVFEVTRNIGGMNVHIRGFNDSGIIKLGTVYIK